jgi:hypothetical protein
LREGQESLKDKLIAELLKTGLTKMPDGRQLYVLNLTELIEEYKSTKEEVI